LPLLIDLYETHADKRDRFEILAFHDPAAKSLADLDTRLPDIRERFWKGRNLPFPILLDATGQTVKQWGIRAFPTAILIDPEGNVVVTDDPLKTLEQILGAS
jgi:hypothetical protein